MASPINAAAFRLRFARKNRQSRHCEVTPPVRYGPHERVMEDTVLSLRIVTTSAAFLTLAAGNALAQTATATAPGKPLQLFQVIQQKEDTAAVQPHHRVRYVHRRAAKTRVANQTANQTTGTAPRAYMEAQPSPEPERPPTTPTARQYPLVDHPGCEPVRP